METENPLKQIIKVKLTFFTSSFVVLAKFHVADKKGMYSAWTNGKNWCKSLKQHGLSPKSSK